MGTGFKRALIILLLYLCTLLVLHSLRLHSPGFVFALLAVPLVASSALLGVGILGGLLIGGLTALLGVPFISLSYLGWIAPLAVLYIASSISIGLIRRERSLYRSLERGGLTSLEELFQQFSNMALIVSLTGEVQKTNNRAKELLGEVVSLEEVFHPDDHRRLREELERAIARGGVGGLRLRAITEDRQILPVEVQIVRLDRDHLALELRDLSELLELERQLHEAEARYRYLIEDAIDTLDSGIILLDRDGRIFWANKTIEKFFYIPRDELIGLELRRALAPAKPFFVEPGSFERITSRSLPTGRGGRYTFTLRGRGTERILELVSIPVETEKYKGGRIDHYIDVTEIKRLERSLREKTARLEETNRRLEEFAHVVSHELKGPPRRIETFAQFLLEDYQEKLDQEGLDYLARIRNQALKMCNLIEDLLLLASLGRKKAPLEEVPLSQVVRDVLDSLDYALKGVEVHLSNSFPTVVANRTQMEELFANLISNGVKYNDKEKKRIEVGWEEEDGHYIIYVRDNGIGIERQYWDKIFELFETLNPQEEDDHESTGAGLAICKRIVEEYGGRIWVESEPGKGSTFYFTIPKRPKVGERE